MPGPWWWRGGFDAQVTTCSVGFRTLPPSARDISESAPRGRPTFASIVGATDAEASLPAWYDVLPLPPGCRRSTVPFGRCRCHQRDWKNLARDAGRRRSEAASTGRRDRRAGEPGLYDAARRPRPRPSGGGCGANTTTATLRGERHQHPSEPALAAPVSCTVATATPFRSPSRSRDDTHHRRRCSRLRRPATKSVSS